MSLPRRLSFRPEGGRYVLRQEAEPASIAGVPLAALDATSVPLAARLDLPADADFTLTLADCDDRQLKLERRGDLLVTTRRDPVSPFLDHAQPVRIECGAALTLWLDYGSAELIAADGTVCVTLQHRMAGNALTMTFQISA